MPNDVHFDCARVVIGKEVHTGVNEGVTVPYQDVRVITVNGQIWEKAFYPFGLDAERVKLDWDKRQLATWNQIVYKPTKAV